MADLNSSDNTEHPLTIKELKMTCKLLKLNLKITQIQWIKLLSNLKTSNLKMKFQEYLQKKLLNAIRILVKESLKENITKLQRD